MSEWNYFVTTQRPTVVTHALGQLRLWSHEPVALAVARATRLEVYRIAADSKNLELIHGTTVHGRVAALLPLERQGPNNMDLLLLCTAKRQLVVLAGASTRTRVSAVANIEGTRCHGASAVGDDGWCLQSVAFASLQVAAGQLVDHEPLATVDQRSRLAVFHLYEGLLTIVSLASVYGFTQGEAPVQPLDLSSVERGVVHVRVADIRIMDIAMLDDPVTDEQAPAVPCGGLARDDTHAAWTAEPRLASLHANGEGKRLLSVWRLNSRTKSLVSDPASAWSSTSLPDASGATCLEPVPAAAGGGMLVLGGGIVLYLNGGGRCLAAAKGGPCEVAAVALATRGVSILGFRPERHGLLRWVLAGEAGDLWILTLQAANDASARFPAALVWYHVGLVSPPRALAMLGAGERLFVGSVVGDSQLIRFTPDGIVGSDTVVGNSIVVDDVLESLGPVVDFCVEDTEGHGHSQIVTCSGVGRTGSLRLVRVGIGFNEVSSSIDVGAVTNMWTLSTSGMPDLLALSVWGGTRIFMFSWDSGPNRINPDDECFADVELNECVAPGLCLIHESLLVCEASGVLQVVRSGVQLASRDTLIPVATWKPPEGSFIQIAAPAPDLVGKACPGVILGFLDGELLLLSAIKSDRGATTLDLQARWRVSSEAACLHVGHHFVVAGLWSRELNVLRLQGCGSNVITSRHAQALPADIVPRSTTLARFSGRLMLLVGLADGRLLTFRIDDMSGELVCVEAVRLGIQAPRLVLFQSERCSTQFVFATGDRPTIIHASAVAGQLEYSAVNSGHVTCVAGLGACDGMPRLAGCLAFVSEKRLCLGRLEEIQRVHVRSVALGESPLKVSYHRRANVFAVACDASLSTASERREGTIEGASVQLVQAHSLEVTQKLRMRPDEHIGAMCVASIGGSDYLAVGTATIVSGEPEPERGRVLLYSAQMGADDGAKDTDFFLSSSLVVSGAVYALLPFGDLLLGSVNNRVVAWRLAGAANSLETLCTYDANVVSIHLQAMGSWVLVGDLMRSATLLRYRADAAVPFFEEVARDVGTAWLTATTMLDPQTFLCSDDCHNIFTLKLGERSSDSPFTSVASGVADEEGRRNEISGATDVGADRTLHPHCGSRLLRVGQLHTGEFINRLQRAALIERPAIPAGRQCDSFGFDSPSMVQTVWASVDGSLGVIVSLRGQAEFSRMNLLQDAILHESMGLAGLPHKNWRDCVGEWGQNVASKGFIDGDLIESMQELPQEVQRLIVERLQSMGMTRSDIDGLLGDLREISQLH
eukprot:TRINITY_DN25782_c0_g2_i1.p1 TRINITY_DN25782_c0_g2~~TRINITY_DN25782_c0_g2_i1.p1  ORF type:complete len:1275 (+),score=169.04 TRINITY_DN25782_c0_g2_i1:260-4084(+)